MNSYRVYLIFEFFSSFLFTLCFTVNLIYQTTVVGLDPLQMVLVGTTLELMTFLFEIPTGVVADVKSRRLSIIIGYVLIGLGFLVEGGFPFFWAVIASQVFWGIGSTFTSGAEEAWIADELGEDRVGEAFVRGSQVGSIAGLIAVPIGVLIGRMDIALPIVMAGGGFLCLSVFLMLVMKETGFKKIPSSERSTWGSMSKTVQDAWQVSRKQVMVQLMLAASLCWGLYSEGFDRLWTPFMIHDIGFPKFWNLEPVVWFGALSMVGRGLNVVSLEVLKGTVDMQRMVQVGRMLVFCSGLMVVVLMGFGWVDEFWAAAGLFVIFQLLRRMSGPLYSTWFNAQIKDPQVRATLFSAKGQINAIGQIVGGPPAGWIGLRVGMGTALQVSAVLLAPIVGCYGAAYKKEKHSQTDGWG